MVYIFGIFDWKFENAFRIRPKISSNVSEHNCAFVSNGSEQFRTSLCLMNAHKNCWLNTSVMKSNWNEWMSMGLMVYWCGELYQTMKPYTTFISQWHPGTCNNRFFEIEFQFENRRKQKSDFFVSWACPGYKSPMPVPTSMYSRISNEFSMDCYCIVYRLTNSYQYWML